MNDSKIDELIKRLEDRSWSIHQQASKELVGIGLPAVKKLTEALLDPNNKVNTAAGIALAEIAPPEIVSILIQACKNEDGRVRHAAVYSLGKVGDKAAVSTIIEVLEFDKNRDVLEAAAGALGDIGDTSAIPALINSLRKPYGAIGSGFTGGALARIGEPALPYLLDALCDNTIEKYFDIEYALITIGKPAVPGLLTILVNENKNLKWHVRPRIAEILGDIGDETAVPALKDALFGNDEELSNAAYSALEIFETPITEQILDEWWSKQ